MIKEIGFVNNIIEANFRKLNSIYKLTYALTFKCNQKCKICSIWKMPDIEELDVDEIGRIFSNLNKLNWVDLTGGEITLRSDILPAVKTIVDNAKNICIFHISTNGTNCGRILDIVKFLSKERLRCIVTVSIDGASNTHDRVRGDKGSYEKAINTYKELKRFKKVKVYISCTISKYNYKYLDEFIACLRKETPFFDEADLHFNSFHLSSHFYDNQKLGEDPKVCFDEVKRYLCKSQWGGLVKRFLEIIYIKNLEKYLLNGKTPFPCQAMKSSVFLDPYGNIYPCVYFNKRIGNLKKFDFDINELLLTSLEKEKVCKMIDKKECPNCWSPCEAYPTILGNFKTILSCSKEAD